MKNKTYPIMYYQRGKESDKKFILQRMSVIPDDLKHEVSEQYERVYGNGSHVNRKAANVWLNDEAMKYKRCENDVRAKATERVEMEVNESKLNPEALKPKVDAIAPPKRKSFLSGLMDDVDKKHSKRGVVR